MASIVFSGQYSDHGGRDWYMEIYSLDSLANVDQELDLMSPGVEITYEMDSSNLAKSMIGSSASITVQMTDDQLAKMETLLTHAEGRVGMFLYNGSSPNMGNLEWAGHLLIEQTSIYMHSEVNTTSLTFSDGLSHLKYIDYKQDSGEMFFDRQSLIRHLFRCLHKLPVLNMIKERFSGSYIFLSETGLPAPVDPGATYQEWSFGASRLDRIFAHSQTFAKPKDQTERHRKLFEEPEFISAYDVVEDICKTLGACITFSNGRWVVWNRTSVFNFSDSQADLNSHSYSLAFFNGTIFISDGRPYIGGGTSLTSDVYQDLTSNAYTLDGATEGRTVPLAKVIMTHEDVERDTIFAEGLSRRRFRWMDPTPGQFSQDSNYFGFPGGLGTQAANDQYSYSSNKNYGYPYLFDFTLYDYTDGTGYFKTNIETANPFFRVGFPDRTNNDLSVDGGQDMTFTFGGSILLREAREDSFTGFDKNTHRPDSVFVIKARIEVTDTDGTKYRLSRLVRVLTSTEYQQETVHIKLDPLVVALGERDHNHKVYNDLKWIEEGEAGYNIAYYEMMAPHGATANNEGEFENAVAQIPGQYTATIFGGEDVTGQNSYGGIFVDWNEQEGRLEAREATVKDQYRNILFKENIKFQAPGDSTDKFTTFKLTWGFEHLDEEGSLLFRSGTSDSISDAVFASSDSQPTIENNDQYLYPQRLILNYADLRLGNGSNDMDLITRSAGGPGLEVYNAGASRLGSRDGLLNPQVTGHLIAPYYLSNGILDDNGSDPSLDGYGFVNLKWIPFKDGDANGPGVGRYNSIHSLIVSEYMACFGEQTRTFQGTIKNRAGSQADILRPYQVFRTPEYDDTVAYDIMLTRVSWSMLEGTQFEGIEINRTRYAQSNITQAEDKPKGPGSGRNPGKPGITEQSYGFTSGFSSGEIGDIGGIAGTNTTKLSNITFDANNEITAIAIKSGSIAFDADKIEDGTTNKVFSSAFKDKLIGIESGATNNASDANLRLRSTHTGTQTHDTISDFDDAVNDVSEVAASKEVTDHFNVDGDGVIDITVKPGSTVLTSDEISEGSTNKFVQPTTFSNAGVLQPRDGSSDAVAAITADLGLITLLADSTIPSYGGVKKFTLADFTTAIVQGGYQDLVDIGAGTTADFTGITGLFGDLNGDGTVGVQDLLQFLTVYGTFVDTDNDLFSRSVVPIRIASGEQESTYASTSQENMYLTFAESDVDTTSGDFTAGSNGVTVLANTDEIQFTSGAGLPITAWTTKRVGVLRDGQNFIFEIQTVYGNQTIDFFAEARMYNSADTLLETEEISMGSFTQPTPTSTQSLTYVALQGFESAGADFNVNNPAITKIKVRIGCRAANATTQDFTVQIRNVRIRLS